MFRRLLQEISFSKWIVAFLLFYLILFHAFKFCFLHLFLDGVERDTQRKGSLKSVLVLVQNCMVWVRRTTTCCICELKVADLSAHLHKLTNVLPVYCVENNLFKFRFSSM